jgi:hypothetical protein
VRERRAKRLSVLDASLTGALVGVVAALAASDRPAGLPGLG